MEGSPFAFSVPNLPTFLANTPPTVDTVLTANITAPGAGYVICLTGIDTSVGISAVELTASYQINSGARIYFGDHHFVVADAAHHYSSWRGEMLLPPGLTIAIRVESLAPADLAITAFGFTVHAPTP